MGGRFLVVSWRGGGNFPPALALSSRLAGHGHEVAIMADAAPADASVVAQVASSGATLLEYPSLEPWPPGLAIEDDPVRFDESRNGVPTANDILAAARAIRPDVIVVDCMAGAGLVAAEVLGIPTAVLVHVLYQPFVCAWADLAVDMTRCRAAFGLDPLPSPAMAHRLEAVDKVLVLVPEALDYPGAPRGRGTFYVGPILDPSPPEPPRDLGFDPSDDRPLVLVSLSTTPQRQALALPPILEAVSRLPVRALLTLGGIDPGHLVVPDNVAVHHYLPHSSVLPDVAVAVSHGGLSTVVAALAAGVPLVCIPQGREQPLNAERVAACGAGIALEADADSDAIAAAIAAVLDEPGYRAGARSMQEMIERVGTGASAVAHVEALLGHPR